MSSVVLSPTTGQTITLAPQWDMVEISPALDLSRLRVVLPAHELENSAFVLKATKNISNFEVDLNGALRIQGLPIQLHAGEILTFVYTGITATWSVTIGGWIPDNSTPSTYYILGTNPLIVQVDPTGILQSADIAFILRQGQLVGMNLGQLRPPAGTLLGGDGNGSYTSLSIDQTLAVTGNTLKVNVGTAPGTVAAGDAFAAAQATANAALPRSGGTLTGPLVLSGAPTVTLNPATKGYVDDSLSAISTTASNALTAANAAVTTANAAMPQSGGTFTGFITLQAAPTATLHAASKGYVDTGVASAATAATTALTAAQAAQTTATGALAKSANLADLGSTAQARLNLGLGSAAVLSVGQGHGMVAAGDDPRILGALQSTIFGTPNGVATLDQFGRLNAAQIPLSLLGAMVYQGTWNSSANTPLLQSGVGTKGQFYVISAASNNVVTLDGVTQFNVGDWVVFDGQKWDKLDGIAAEVLSVLGNTGAVTLTQLVNGGVAPLASPALTGTPTTPTPANSDNSTTLTNTAWVTGNFLKNAGGTLTGTTINSATIGNTTPGTGAFTTLSATGDFTMTGTGALQLPAGTTAQQPTGAAGKVRYNTDTSRYEFYVPGTGWINHVRKSGDTVTGTLTVSTLVGQGGTIDATAIGGTTPAAGVFTTLGVTGSQSASFVLAAPTGSAGAPTWRKLANTDISGLGTMSTQAASAVAITGGAIDGTAIGGSTPAAGSFTTVAASSAVTLGSAASLLVGPATGGNKGAGTINATAIYVNGAAVGIAGGYTLPAATTTTLGGVIVPTSGNLSVDGSGNISVAATVWTTPGTIGSTTPNTGAFTTLSASGNVSFSGTGTVKLPVGTDAQRGTVAQGQIRFSSTSTRLETYNGTAWVSYVRLDGDTMTGTLSLASLTCTGGTIDNTAIGSTTPASAKFTTINASSDVTVGSSGALVVGSPTGGTAGNMGAGTINATAIYINGAALSASTGGTMAAQNANSVAITGGAIDGTTIGATTASTGRFTTLALTTSQAASTVLAAPSGGGAPTFRQLANTDITGFGTMATQAASSVAITGGTINGTSIGATTPGSGTFTTATVGANAQAGASLNLNSAAANARSLAFLTAGSNRWLVSANNTAESGSNAGSDLTIASYTDAGAALATPLSITRSSGLVTMGNVAISGGAINGTSIGATTASTGKFTTLTLTSSQAASTVLAAPVGSAGAPTFRALTTSDISGFGTMATQAANSVAITGGSLSGVTLSSLSSIDFGSSVGVKINLWSTSMGMGINSSELAYFVASGNTHVFRIGTGALTATAVATIDGNGIQGTKIGATTAATGRFTTVTATGTGSSIPGYPTSAQMQPVSVTLALPSGVTTASYFFTGNSPFAWTITNIRHYGGGGSGSFTYNVINVSNTVASNITASAGATVDTAPSANTAVSVGAGVYINVTAVSGTVSSAHITLNGTRTGLG